MSVISRAEFQADDPDKVDLWPDLPFINIATARNKGQLRRGT
jgi:hypothetical protein